MHDTTPATPLRILIVEDEFIIGDMIARRLTKLGHQVVGHAFSYEEAIQLHRNGQPDLALLDIRLNGMQTGIDVAEYLARQTPAVPYIYLTSQTDPATLAQARNTFPAGYLSKPVQMRSLLTTIDIAMHNFRATQDVPTITLKDGRDHHIIIQSTIRYLQADHVYVKVIAEDKSPLVCRTTLGELLGQLQRPSFVQTHRSYVVNLDYVDRYDRECVYIDGFGIPVSRGRREEVFSRL